MKNDHPCLRVSLKRPLRGLLPTSLFKYHTALGGAFEHLLLSIPFQLRSHSCTMSENIEPIFLVWGSNGWIAGYLLAMLHQHHKQVHGTAVRMENQQEVNGVLERIKPTYVINCAGMTGRPNVDECEHRKLDTIESNVTGTLILTKACNDRGIHITVLATGCKSTQKWMSVEQTNIDRYW